jgi:hypothetical protein
MALMDFESSDSTQARLDPLGNPMPDSGSAAYPLPSPPTAQVPLQGDTAGGLPSWYNQGQVDSWYQSELGRPATNPDAGTGGHYGMEHAGAGSMDAIYGIIHNSPEAQAHRTQTTGTSIAPRDTGQTDPSQQLLSQYALDRFNQRLNPNPNSGTSMYETYARQLFDTLKGPAYSDADAQTLKANAYDGMEQERSSTKQRYMEELSRRGIPPSSGVALQGLIKIDNHFAGLRTQVERGFATQAMEAQRQNQIQALSVAAQLAAEEEGRQSDALQFAMLPYQLQNDSFSRNLQLVNAGGSPMSALSGLLGVANYGQGVNTQNQSNRASSANALGQYLSFLLGL